MNGISTRWRKVVLLTFVCFAVGALAPGCRQRNASTASRKSVPALSFRPRETVAYVNGLGISVYLVRAEEVVVVRLLLHKEKRLERHTVLIEHGGASAKLFRGEGIWGKVRPAGVRPPPSEPYQEEDAVEGKIICEGMPAAMTYPYGDTAVSIVEADIVFPSGRIRISEPMRLVLQAWPP